MGCRESLKTLCRLGAVLRNERMGDMEAARRSFVCIIVYLYIYICIRRYYILYIMYNICILGIL